VTNDREPLTGGHDGREDIAVLQAIVAALGPAGLGGEAAEDRGSRIEDRG
jgi:hypothetical protein